MKSSINKKGFTILELLVVVAIIAIIAVIALPNFTGRIEEAKDSRELAEINAVEKAVSNYYVDNGVYPTLQGKDGTLLQPQPVLGSPHNIDFSSLVPNYLATLPHFSYWWVDEKGDVFHTQKPLGSVTGGVFTPTVGYTYTLYKTNGTSQVLSAPYTLLAGEYVVGKDDKGVELPKVGSAFKNAKAHPEDPEYVTPVLFTSQTFDYTGSVQTFTVTVTGTYKLEVWGASGGGNTTYLGGQGGYAYGEKTLVQGQLLYIYVGQQGIQTMSSPLGGWNGGGGVVATSNMYGGTGGGGTDIRTVSGLWNNGSSLSSRIIVAGGGGGSYIEGDALEGLSGSRGGAGGGLVGLRSTVSTATAADNGYGGTQTAGGATGVYPSSGHATAGGFGYGGKGDDNDAGGGGGGWYGGGGGENNGSGGGGSSYISGLSSSGTTAGQKTGNGQAKITYVGP